MKLAKIISRLFTFILVITFVQVIAACNSQDFSGRSGQRGGRQSTPSNGDHQNPKTGPSGDCFETRPRVHFMFVIDKTSSMESSIATVIDKVSDFSRKIEAIKLDGAKEPLTHSKFAAISYLDTEQESMSIEFTDDVQKFAQQLRSHNYARGSGGDVCEGGFLAAKTGVEMLSASFSAEDPVVPVLIVISDNFSHTGTGSGLISGGRLPSTNKFIPRSFDEKMVVDAAKGSLMKHLIMIDATPKVFKEDLVNGSTAGCMAPGRANPSEQWSKIREELATIHNRDVTSMGSSIGFTAGIGFDSASLLDAIPAEIQKSIKICK